MMPRLLTLLGIAALTSSADAEPTPSHGLEAVAHGSVTLGGFWGERLRLHQEVTLPHALDCLEKDGHVENFDLAAGVGSGKLRGHHAFDSDLYKALEGVFLSLRHTENKALFARADAMVDRIIRAQQEDGYLVAYYILTEEEEKWGDLRLRHELYNAGHFFEMAVAHHQLTGDAKALDAAKRFADHIDARFGPGKLHDVPGHQEIEMALIKLYTETGERRYLELSRFFLDERGHAHGGTKREPFDPASVRKPEVPEGKLTPEQQREIRLAKLRMRNGRMQDHMPLLQQREAVGHAVRAGYVYSAMADLARFSDAPDYADAVDRLWDDVVSHKLYLTGGIGSAEFGDEGFGVSYRLPNESAYSESCASIANVFWNHRMALLKAESKYADVMELSLYNAVLASVAVTGDAFFYQNPLANKGGAKRSSWIGLSCCPTNVARIFPQVGGLAYALSGDRVYVNLFVDGSATLSENITIAGRTEYPWNGKTTLTITLKNAAEFELCLRLPEWAQGGPVAGDLYRYDEPVRGEFTLKINGEIQALSADADGYLHCRRMWNPGDTVEFDLPMPVRRVIAHNEVEANRGKVALMRGPIVYCFEGVDLDLAALTLSGAEEWRAEHRPDFLGGVTVLRSGKLTAIPYYAWQNRGKSPMTVWVNRSAAR